MSRLRADMLLLLVAFIWGVAFVAQKAAFDHIGAFTFIAARFILSAILVVPLAIREYGRKKMILKPDIAFLCCAFFTGIVTQQVGMQYTTVTNAGFLTGLYVLFVPLICLLVYKDKISPYVFPVALLSVFGVWLLSGSTLAPGTSVNKGDLLVLASALAFGFHVTLVGRISRRTAAPLQMALLQYIAVAIVAALIAFNIETPKIENIMAAWGPILYAGAISGAIAYTLQMVAQQYAPASDSAVIMSGEAVFAAIAGVIIMGDRLPLAGWCGATIIFAAILAVECIPYLLRNKKAAV